ncbi:MAG: hypothetical protein JSS02_12015, partial [Planctomycetes bacterium]|nr:hypothetical protein [Planctomycetota bacterium]
MAELICGKCHGTFEMADSTAPNACPHCGSLPFGDNLPENEMATIAEFPGGAFHEPETWPTGNTSEEAGMATESEFPPTHHSVSEAPQNLKSAWEAKQNLSTVIQDFVALPPTARANGETESHDSFHDLP